MNERWKYQIKVGLFWGLFMVICISLFEWKEKPILVELTTFKFYVRAALYIVVGIFAIGYFHWKEKKKQEEKK